MGKPRPKVLVSALKRAADNLNGVAAQLMEAHQILLGAEMDFAYIPWTNADSLACDKLVETGNGIVGPARTAATAHLDKRKSRAETERERSARDYKKRLEKEKAAGVEPKPRGRPPKKSSP